MKAKVAQGLAVFAAAFVASANVSPPKAPCVGCKVETVIVTTAKQGEAREAPQKVRFGKRHTTDGGKPH